MSSPVLEEALYSLLKVGAFLNYCQKATMSSHVWAHA